MIKQRVEGGLENTQRLRSNFAPSIGYVSSYVAKRRSSLQSLCHFLAAHTCIHPRAKNFMAWAGSANIHRRAGLRANLQKLRACLVICQNIPDSCSSEPSLLFRVRYHVLRLLGVQPKAWAGGFNNREVARLKSVLLDLLALLPLDETETLLYVKRTPKIQLVNI